MQFDLCLCVFLPGINRKVRYAMKELDGQFVIDSISGIVSLTRPLDREEQAVYNLTLYAHDQVGDIRIYLLFKEFYWNRSI